MVRKAWAACEAVYSYLRWGLIERRCPNNSILSIFIFAWLHFPNFSLSSSSLPEMGKYTTMRESRKRHKSSFIREERIKQAAEEEPLACDSNKKFDVKYGIPEYNFPLKSNPRRPLEQALFLCNICVVF